MDSDPKSYRVPIVHLSDMFKKTSEPSDDGSDVTNDTKKETEEKTTIREEDVQAAVITPSTPSPTLKDSEKTPTVDIGEGVNLIQEEYSPSDLQSQLSPEANGTLENIDEEPFPETTAIEIQETKIEEEPFDVDSELPPQPDIKQFGEVDTVTQQKEIPQATTLTEASLQQEVKPEEDDIQKLINENLLVSAVTQENAKTEKTSIPEEKNIPDLSQSAVLPTANPLDIWEQDAIRREKEPIRQAPSVVKETVIEEKTENTGMGNLEIRAPEQEIFDTETEGVPSEKDSFEALVPLTKKPLEEQVPTISPIEEKKLDGAGNLDALRKRVLAGGNTQPATQPIHIEDTILVKEIDENRPKPVTKHASAIADVADKLQNITQEQENGGYTFNTPSSTDVHTLPRNEAFAVENDVTEIDNTVKPEVIAPGSLVQPAQTNTVPKSSVPLIRTFKADVEQAVMKDRTSIVDMVSAEEKRRGLGETVRMAPRPKASGFSRLVMIVSVMMVFVGLGIGGYILFRLFTIDRHNASPIIPVSETTEYDITGQSGKELLGGLTKLKETMEPGIGSVTELHFIERFDDERGVGVDPVQPSYFFERLETQAPGMLIRTMTDTMTFGFHSLQKNEPFWIFPINHYAVSFRGMLEWEDSMREDLAPLFTEPTKVQTTPNTGLATSTGTTTASSTIPTPSEESTSPEIKFEDMTIANKETRGLKDKNGKIILLWAVPDSKTVAITTNRATMEMLIGRMNARFSE